MPYSKMAPGRLTTGKTVPQLTILKESDMTTILSDTDHGEMVLKIYSHFNVKPGEALTSNNFVAWAARNRVRADVVDAGLDFAVREGWLVEVPDGSLALTESGFRKM